ncbi:suppressor of tumorigenicity 14 protein homolog [Ambystoma mexicanum]|uniref:suppressor of tumorigenicity 14 protein homolog n=1 Tax=Ambystoma mexicanum TaxID=8296 RepID=UPI0037E829A6
MYSLQQLALGSKGMLSFSRERISVIYSIPIGRDPEHMSAQSLAFHNAESHRKDEKRNLQLAVLKVRSLHPWKRKFLRVFPIISLAAIIIILVLYYSSSPALTVFYVGGSVDISNQNYTSALADPESQTFISQAEAMQNYLAELYESSIFGKYYLKSVIAAFSERTDGVRVYYWSAFMAPEDIYTCIKKSATFREKEYVSKQALQILNSSAEALSSEDDLEVITTELFASGSGEFDVAVKSAISFDLYAKPGNNRTLTLINPKKSFYQWRLRVPQNYVVRLIVLTMNGATPGNCVSYRLSAYDFLLPLQNKIITRWCGPPMAWNLPMMRLTSSSNVMLVTFSLDRTRENNMLKAYFQAIPKVACGGRLTSWNGSLSSPYYPSYYPPNIECSWIIKAPRPGYRLSLHILVIQIQEKSPGSRHCDKDWLEIEGIRHCKPVVEGSKPREYGYSVSINFHSDEIVTHKGFYIEFKTFSHLDPCPRQFKCMDGSSCVPLKNQCDGWKDCADGSDERDCGCSPEELNCGNGKCRTQSRICNGDQDCRDSSDESDCSDEKKQSRKRLCVPDCGRSQVKKNRIVGGEDAKSGKWPWQASLQIGMHGHVCGASIIAKKWLVSAAHCFQDTDPIRYSLPSIWTVHIGMRIITKNYHPPLMKSVRRIIVHPRYDRYASDYDIALLELEAPLSFSEVVYPICLPSNQKVFSPGTVCYVTGWGSQKENGELARILQEAKVKIINQSVCNKLYDDSITSRMMCAGNLGGGVDACQGDSGGPLACLGRENRWYLAGIVSWGEGCARRSRPGVYTKVTELYDWVQEQIN